MARDRVVELRRVRAGDLRPDPRNWRRHPPGQRAALSRMLDRLGYVDAVIARETPDGLVLVDGHLRAGMSPDAQIPVLVVDLDHSEAGEVLATLDPLAAMAEADRDALARLLSDLDAPPPIDLKEMYALAPEPAELKPADVEPILPSEPVSRCGDLWLLGRHRLMCGDATERSQVTRLLDGAQPSLMVTDPPYGVGPMMRRGARRPSAPAGDASVKCAMMTIRPTGPRPSKPARLQWRTSGLPQGKTCWSSAASSKRPAMACETKSSGANPKW